jgi:methylglyoxal synthase
VKENNKTEALNIQKLKSGPLGGDQQLGAMICEGEIDILIFLWDAMEPQPHDVDVKALLRITTLYNVVSACNRATADFIIASSLFDVDYEAKATDFSSYLNRRI